jgi:hypothetical protein
MGIELGPLEKSTSPAMKKIWLVILEKKVMGATQCHKPPISEWFNLCLYHLFNYGEIGDGLLLFYHHYVKVVMLLSAQLWHLI